MNTFQLKTRVCFGDGALDALAEIRAENAVIFTDSFMKKSGTLGPLVGGALGALFAIVCLTIHYLNDTRIKDENDLAALYPLPVLGRIPDFDLTSSGKSYGYGKNSGYGNTEAKEAEAQK